LKPGNIMLVKSGAKLLDFGLAKLQAAETPTNLSALPTEQANLTAEGTILGTLQYMAPEQLEGKEADGRTDIFAFGAVVYEMATGKKAFEGKSQASLIGAILKDDPAPMSELKPMTPSLLDQVVKKCLAKEPDERWQTATDLMTGLRWVTEVGVEVRSAPSVTGPPAWKRAVPWSIAVAAVVIGISIAFWTAPQPISPSTRFAITPSLEALANTQGGDLAISADGRNVLYKANTERGIQLYLHSLDDLVDRPIPGTEGLDNLGSPFFSPDGESVAFFEGGQLKRVSLAAGGSPITLCEAPGPGNEGSWGSDDMIVFSGANGLYRVSAAGGEPEIVATPDPDKGEAWYVTPLILPGGRTVLFSIYGAGHQIAALSLETGEQKTLIENGRQGKYVETGHLIYEQAETGNLMASSLDLARLEVTSDPVPVLQGVRQAGQVVDYALSDEGTLVYVPHQQEAQSLVWVDRKGTESLITQGDVSFGSPRISPDGKQVAVAISGDQTQNIWIYDFDSESLRRLTFGSGSVETWSPDGQWIIFQFEDDKGQRAISRQLADGSGPVEHLTDVSVGAKLPGSLTPDGSVLAFDRVGDIWMLPMQGDTEPQPFITSPNTQANAKFSPDGKWLVYVSDELGLDQVYVSPFPNPDNVKWLVSEEGGGQPVWSPDGTELFYRNGDRMMVVSVQKDPAFRAGRSEVLFEGTYFSSAYVSGYQYYDISPDGQRFLMIKAVEGSTGQIHVTLNWFEELKRRPYRQLT